MSRTLMLSILLAIPLVVGCGGTNGGTETAPDFVNGGFESPVLSTNSWSSSVDPWADWSGGPDWGIENGSSSWGTGSHSGAQFAFLQGHSTLSQTVSGFRLGRHYHVTFWFARRNGNVGGNEALPITLWEGATRIVPETSPTDDAIWRQVTSDSFVADSSDITFEFRGIVPYTDMSTLFDDVKVVAE